MTSTRLLVSSAVAALTLLLSGAAAADTPPSEPIHVTVPSTITTEKNRIELPPGYFLTEPLWDKLDLEVKRLQTAETRLTAENVELRKTTAGGPGRLTLIALATAAVLGIVVGVAIH